MDLGKAEAVMPAREQVPGEATSQATGSGPSSSRSRTPPAGRRIILDPGQPQVCPAACSSFEVTEIADGTVKIEAFAREPGYRTKIAVTSRDPKVDPVGACTSAHAARA